MSRRGAFAISLLLSLCLIISPVWGCTMTVAQTAVSSWTDATGATMIQYNIDVTNNGPEAVSSVTIVLFGGVLSSYWSATQAGAAFSFPGWVSSLPSGSTWSWGFIIQGVTALEVLTTPSCSVTVAESGNTSPPSSNSGSNSNSGSANSGSANTGSANTNGNNGGSSSGNGGSSGPKCTGSPATYNGLPCATTTRYFDGTTGACGCGVGDNGPFPWQASQYTAAGSQGLFGGSDATTWCGPGCGTCYELTPTGDCPQGGAGCASQMTPIVVMITNLCPYIYNQEWCPNPGNTNQYGYGAHFDLLDTGGLVDAIGWNNPAVTYRQVACGSSGSPTCSEAGQCQCSAQSNMGGNCASGGATSYTRYSEGFSLNSTHPALSSDPALASEALEAAPVVIADKQANWSTKSLIIGACAGTIGTLLIVAIVSLGKFIAVKKAEHSMLAVRMEPLLGGEAN